jgi:hypothetical protein
MKLEPPDYPAAFAFQRGWEGTSSLVPPISENAGALAPEVGFLPRSNRVSLGQPALRSEIPELDQV